MERQISNVTIWTKMAIERGSHTHDPSLMKRVPFKLGDTIRVDGDDGDSGDTYVLGYVKKKNLPVGTRVCMYDPDGYIIAFLERGTFYRYFSDEPRAVTLEVP